MDPITHGIIGLGIGALSGQPASLTNPVLLGSMLGAMAPDLDIVAKKWGDYCYLKHHRGISHSVIGLGAISIVIALGLNLISNGYGFFNILLWTFFGSLSHTVFDALNSYGVKALTPIIKRKLSASILMLYDPFITALSIILIFSDWNIGLKRSFAAVFFVVYIVLRSSMRGLVYRELKNRFGSEATIMKISVLPALINFFKWDFIVETDEKNIVGQINIVSRNIIIRKSLNKTEHHILKYIKDTEMGRYFSEFSPLTHVEVTERGKNIILKVIDLRYFMKNNFMHHATIVFNHDTELVKSIFHPYSFKNNIVVENKEAA